MPAAENNVVRRYPMDGPFQDRRNHPSKVKPGTFVRAWGLDGRFVSAARTFPGFKKVLNLKASPFTNQSWKTLGSANPTTDPYYWMPSVDNSGMTTVYFAKYLSVQIPQFTIFSGPNVTGGGQAGRILRGFAIAHDYTDSGTQRGAFRFYFYDPVAGRWAYHDLLREIANRDALNAATNTTSAQTGNTWTATARTFWPWYSFLTDEPGLISATSEYDVCSMGNFIYYTVLKNPRTQTNTGPTTIHRSIWCAGLGVDLPAATGTGAGAGFSHNAFSLWYPTPIGPADTKFSVLPAVPFTPTTLSVDAPITGAAIYSPSDRPQPAIMRAVAASSGGDVTGRISQGIRVFASKKNVEGPLQWVQTTATDGNKITYNIAQWQFYEFVSGVLIRRPKMPTHALDLYLRSYRTLDSQSFDDSNAGTAALGGTMFREASTASLFGSVNAIHPDATSDYTASTVDNVPGSAAANGDITDNLVIYKTQIDPFRDDVAYGSRVIRLLQPYQGTLLRIGSVPVPEPPAVLNDREEILSWGALTKFAPEQFRIVDSTPLGSTQDEHALAIATTGDYAFIVGDSAIFRLHRNGSLMAINEIQSLNGGVGRWAITTMGTSLFFIAPSGLYEVEGASSEFRLVSAFDRIILEDWRGTLSSVRMTYDAVLGALMVLNTDDEFQEMQLLWLNTGGITGLRNVPFKFAMNGIDPKRVDLHRSFWITDAGVVYTPNAERSSYSYDGSTQGAFSLCGGDPTKLWNAEVTFATPDAVFVSVPDAVQDIDNTAVVGFKVAFTAGPLLGESFPIRSTSFQTGGPGNYSVIIPLDTATWGSTQRDLIVAAVDAGEEVRLSVAPVGFEPIGWPFGAGDSSVDLFVRKKLTSMAHHLNLIAGEVDVATNPNLVMDHTVYQRSELGTPVATSQARMGVDQTGNYTHNVAAGACLYPGWRCLASNVDFELLEGRCRGTIEAGEAETSPVGPRG